MRSRVCGGHGGWIYGAGPGGSRLYFNSFKHLLQFGRLGEPTQPIGLQPNPPPVVGGCENADLVGLLDLQPRC